MLEKLLNYISRYKYTVILSVVTFICIIITCTAVKSCCKQKSISSNNIAALTDTISYYKSKSGDIVATKRLLEGDIKLLKTTNDSLYNVIKDMKLKNPTTVINASATIDNGKHDTVWIVQKDSVINVIRDFNFTNEYRQLTGNVYHKDSILGLNIKIDKVFFDYTIAVENSQVYIKSNNPYVKYNEITGLTTPNTRKNWSIGIGPQIGYGYNFVAKQFNPYIGIGVNIQYNLFSW